MPVPVATKKTGGQDGLVELVAHLRRDNMRLREALIAAQEEASKMAKGSDSVDFKHLLSLVRDFGGEEWCGGDAGAAINTDSPLPVSDSGSSTRCSSSPDPVAVGTPTGATEMFSLDDGDEEGQAAEDAADAEDVPMFHADDAILDKELIKSREEVLHLRAKLEASQREVTKLRRQAEAARTRA